MINIVIPMAGHGSRFSKAGYCDPKPLIPVLGKPMIELVIENLRPSKKHRFIFICQAEHLKNYPLRTLLIEKAPGCKIIAVSEVTEGAACTVLLVKELIDNHDQLMIANCDQYIQMDIDKYLAVLESEKADGLIMTMKAYDDKWSFVKFNMKKDITLVLEKEVISDEATVGIYNFKHGSDFVKAAELMISLGLRVNNEFYVAPVYNQMIKCGKKIRFYNIGKVGEDMYGLGTPEELNCFLQDFA
jgi:NDP-sugar pyrophosphorylase family protein